MNRPFVIPPYLLPKEMEKDDTILLTKGQKQKNYDDELSPKSVEELLTLQKEAKKNGDKQLAIRIDGVLKNKGARNKQSRSSRGY